MKMKTLILSVMTLLSLGSNSVQANPFGPAKTGNFLCKNADNVIFAQLKSREIKKYTFNDLIISAVVNDELKSFSLPLDLTFKKYDQQGCHTMAGEEYSVSTRVITGKVSLIEQSSNNVPRCAGMDSKSLSIELQTHNSNPVMGIELEGQFICHEV